MAHALHRITLSAETTREFGRTIGKHLSTTMLITLYGDLGSGKTVLVQGLAKGLLVPDAYVVTSPSYTLVNEYPGRLKLYHIDLYRLAGTSDFDDIGLWDMLDGEGIVAIEWSERLESDPTQERLCIHLKATLVYGGSNEFFFVYDKRGTAHKAFEKISTYKQ